MTKKKKCVSKIEIQIRKGRKHCGKGEKIKKILLFPH